MGNDGSINLVLIGTHIDILKCLNIIKIEIGYLAVVSEKNPLRIIVNF